MTAHRFYLPPERCVGTTLQLDKREAHHALRVLRLKPGDPAAVLDGVGHEFTGEISHCSRDTVTVDVKQSNFAAEPPCPVTLLVAIPKGKIIESIVQKAVELGTRRIVPLLTERVITHLNEEERADKREKWQQVAIEAIKQCGASWLPRIETPTTIDGLLNSTLRTPHSAFDLSLVGSLQDDRRHPRECFQEFRSRHGRQPKSVAIWIGPEGDFTPDELKIIKSSGASPISLGRLVLRVETAAIYCLSIANYELGHEQ